MSDRPKGNPYGSKKEVLSRKRSRKRKGFCGTAKSTKKPSNPVTEITFVHDADVGEQEDQTFENRPKSASKKKLSVNMDSEEDCIEEEAFIPAKGYRFVDLDSLEGLAQRIHRRLGMCEGTVSLIEDTSKRYGLCSSIYATCDGCDMREFLSTGKHDLCDQVPRTVQAKDVNRRAVFAASEVGLGREGIKAICEIFDIPCQTYRYMVSDADSKAFNEIWDTYGVCDSCKTHHSLDKSSKEYKEWRDSEEYKKSEDEHTVGSTECRRVEKLDCINHVSKRMGKALRTVQEKRGKLPDGKPVGGGRLTTKTIQKLQNYYGKAIRNNVKKGILSADEKSKAVKAMKREIKAGLYHSCKLPGKERHKFCPENSWCSFKTTGREVAPKSHHLDPVICAHLEPIYDRLSEENLLRRCLGGYTQNPNESINSLVWSRCPKHKWFGRGRVEMAVVSAAALQFSAGATAKHRVMSLAGIPPGSSTMKASSRRDSLRVQKAETRSTEQYKRFRGATKKVAVRIEEDRKEAEGLTYGAGSF